MSIAAQLLTEHLLGRPQAGEREQRGGAFRAARFRTQLLKFRGERTRLVGEGRVTDRVGHKRGFARAHESKGLRPGLRGRLVVLGGPVEERTRRPFAVLHARQHVVERRRDVRRVLLQVVDVAGVAVPFRDVPEPPEGVRGHPVHPLVRRGRGGHVVERRGKDVRRAEHGEDGHRFGVRISHPHEAVALDAVPEIGLAAEMDRLHGGLEHGVEPLVRRTERPEALHRPHDRHGTHVLKLKAAVSRVVDPRETESRLSDLALSEPRKVDYAVAYRVVVARPALTELAHRLRHRLAEPHARTRAFAASRAAPDLERSMELAPEVHDDPLARIQYRTRTRAERTL